MLSPSLTLLIAFSKNCDSGRRSNLLVGLSRIDLYDLFDRLRRDDSLGPKTHVKHRGKNLSGGNISAPTNHSTRRRQKEKGEKQWLESAGPKAKARLPGE